MTHDEMRFYRREIINSYKQFFYLLFGCNPSIDDIKRHTRRLEMSQWDCELRAYA